MSQTKKSVEERIRQNTIDQLGILDTPAEKEYDNLVELAALICEVEISYLSFLYDDRQWFKASTGLNFNAPDRQGSFCQQAFLSEESLFIIEDAKLHPTFKNHYLVLGEPFIRFYAGVKIYNDEGVPYANFCIMSKTPKQLSEQQKKSLLGLSDQVSTLLNHRRVKAVQKKKKEHLEIILENAQDLIYELDIIGNITFANILALETFQISEMDLGKTKFISMVDSGDFLQINKTFSDLIERKKTVAKNVFKIINRNGKVIWLSQTLKIVKDKNKILKIIGVSRNITNEKENSDRLNRLSLVAENTSNIVIIMDSGFKIEWVNNAFQNVFGYHLEEVIGLVPGDFLNGPKTNLKQVKLETDKLLKGESILLELINYDKSGKEKWIEMSISPVFSENNLIVNYIALEQDITGRKKQIQLIEAQHKEIIESMEYATRIQQAALPSDEWRERLSKESFVIYRPKDIVSGDSYLTERRYRSKDDIVEAFVVGDCTGHGVPGAMLSILCSNILIEAINDIEVKNAGKALDYAKKRLFNFFQFKGERKVYDGMDTSFLAIHSKDGKVYYSGANRPLFLISDGELTVIKGNKQSVGYSKQNVPFENTEIEYKKGNMAYMFSDGIVDQFGGERDRKFMTKRLKSILLDIYNQPLNKQKKVLENELIAWQGDNEQTDDICFMGVRL